MGFRKIFWGILFLLVTFRINGFDVLPDVIGYFLIFTGLTALQSYSPHFVSGRMLAVAATLLSIFTIYEPPANTAYMWMPPALSFIFGLAVLIINALLFYRICSGIADMAQGRGDIRLAETAMQRWRWFFLIMIISLGIWLFGMIIPLIAFLIIPLLVVTIVIYALMMGLMNQAERSLG